MSLSKFLGAFWFGFFIGLSAWGSPDQLTYQGRILKSDGQPLEYNNVSFIFEVTSENGLCVLYREQRDGLNMSNSKGVFDVPIGSGTRLFPDTSTAPSYKLSDSFVNGVTHNCFGSGTWTATGSSYRLLKVQFHDGVGWKQISPDSVIRSVPFAMTAKSATQLGDKTINDFVLKTNAPGAACSVGQVVFWDGTNFSCVTDAGGAGVISDVLAGTGISVTGTTSKTVSVTFGTTAGTAAQGNDSRITNALQSSTVFAGDVTGTAATTSVDRIKGVAVDAAAPTSGQVLRFDGAKWAAATPNAGTVTSVGVSVPSFLSASGGPVTSSGTIAISLASQTGNTVFAAPNGSNGAPSFRNLGIADIYSSVGGLSFLNTTPSCAAGSALTYVSATDRIQCAVIAVDSANIANNAITTAKIADGAVSAVKLGTDVGVWAVSSGNVSRTTGTVGVGTTATSSTLTVGANSLVWPNFGLDVLGINTSDLVRFKNTTSNTLVHIVADSGRNSAVRFIEDGIGEYALGRDGADDKFKIAFGANISTNNLLTMTASGLTGLGNSSPVTSLDLSSKTDAIYFPKGATAQQPGTPAAGMIRYNTDNNAVEFYNGSSWFNLSAITSGGTMTNVSTITGGTSGVSIAAGGTNQNVTLTASGTGTVTTGSVMTVTNSTASTAYNNGALVVSGGVGVSGNINSNGNIYSSGSISSNTAMYSPIIYGSTAASGTLTLDSTSSATKGSVILAPGGGNVGVGTGTPAQSLEVVKNIDANAFVSIVNNSTGNNARSGFVLTNEGSSYGIDSGGMMLNGTANAAPDKLLMFSNSGVAGGIEIVATHSTAPITFKTSLTANERMRITPSGEVGIGTSSPTAMLEVAGSSGGTSTPIALIKDTYAAGNAAMPFIDFKDSAGTTIAQIGDTSAANSDLTLYTPNDIRLRGTNILLLNGAGAEQMRLDASGRVGIGTSTPLSKLQVAGGVLRSDLAATGPSFIASGTGSNFHIAHDGSANVALYNSGGGIQFRDTDGTTNLFTIKPGGLVGIGTASPVTPLHINNGSNYGAIMLGGNGGTNNHHISHELDGSLRIYNGTFGSGNEQLRITSSGNVGIGTTNPTFPLYVNNVTNWANGSYYNWGYGTQAAISQNTFTPNVSIFSAGYVAAAAYIFNSDERIKDIIGVSNAKKDLEILQKIQVTDYRYKDPVRYGSQITKKVIAQQIEKILPSAVVKRTDFIPNISAVPEAIRIKDDTAVVTLSKEPDIKVGDLIQIYNEKNQEVQAHVVEVSGRVVTLSYPNASTFGAKIFIYGKQVHDFRSVDYEAIGMLNVSATQELARQVSDLSGACQVSEEQMRTLQQRLDSQDRMIASLAEENRKLKQEIKKQDKMIERIRLKLGL